MILHDSYYSFCDWILTVHSCLFPFVVSLFFFLPLFQSQTNSDIMVWRELCQNSKNAIADRAQNKGVNYLITNQQTTNNIFANNYFFFSIAIFSFLCTPSQCHALSSDTFSFVLSFSGCGTMSSAIHFFISNLSCWLYYLGVETKESKQLVLCCLIVGNSILFAFHFVFLNFFV